jgi:MFS family permease
VTTRFGGLLIDISPLREDRDYRWLWLGQVVSGIGNHITRLALPYQVYVITGSTLAIAGLTLFQLIPLLLFALGAGSLADAVDRRRLLLVAQVGLLACSLALFGLATVNEPPIQVLFVIAFISAGLFAVEQPARVASVPRLVPPERLPSALALNQLNFQAVSILGPAIGGLIIALMGLSGAYLFDAVTFAGSIGALLMIHPIRPIVAASKPGLAAIREGLAFARARRPILGSMTIDFVAMVFAMPTALFPVLALDVFKVGPLGLGLMAAAPAVGAFLGAIFSGWVRRVERVGRAVVLAVTGWGLAIVGFGIAATLATPTSFVIGLVFLALAGASDMVSAVFRNTILQLEAPDELRGRVTSINSLVVHAGPRIGDIESALLASLIGPGLTVVAGGVLCLAGVFALGRWLPDLGHHIIRRSGATQAPG